VIHRERFYDTIAGDFDRIMNRYDLERRLEVMFDDLLGAEDLGGRQLLDAGSGTGHFSARARARGASVIAVDIGPNLLEEARRKGVERVVASDVGQLAFPDGAFDIVISSECIEHTPSPRTSVIELMRVLRPGGTLALTCPNRTWRWSCTVADVLGIRPYLGLENWPSWRQLRRWLEEGGLVVERHIGIHLFPFALKATHPVLRRLDRAGAALGPLYVNQCVRAVKPSV
jgi:2-polyprenyl-3-methyl-5-hydroxy-6-metoxy-1,4-benzoquinol methylase